MRKLLSFTLLLSALAVFTLSPRPSAAQPHSNYDNGWQGDRHWHGDTGVFRAHDLGYWQTGHWYHGVRSGRLNWWWVVGPHFYGYGAPIYPYPDPYVPPVVTSVAVNSVYFCKRPYGYYPYVPVCHGHWHARPAY